MVMTMGPESLVLSIVLPPVQGNPIVRSLVGSVLNVFRIPTPQVIAEFELIVEVRSICWEMRVPTFVCLFLETWEHRCSAESLPILVGLLKQESITERKLRNARKSHLTSTHSPDDRN